MVWRSRQRSPWRRLRLSMLPRSCRQQTAACKRTAELRGGEMSELLVEDTEGLRRITMNRPEKRNALTRAMYAGMADTLREAATRPSIRAILITGGPECFTAGNDIHDFRGRADASGEGTSPARGFIVALR